MLTAEVETCFVTVTANFSFENWDASAPLTDVLPVRNTTNTVTVYFAVSHFAFSHYLTQTITPNPNHNPIPNPNPIPDSNLNPYPISKP